MTTVLLTGASGFIAKHILRELLANGYDVKAATRSERSRQQVEALFPDANISYVSLDLLKDEGWDEAMVGVDVLLHTASPFPIAEPKDPQEVIRPAVDGTRRALAAAQKAGVTRVVLTSSCAAVYKDSAKAPHEPSTRENWTDPNGKATGTYEASKTLAERAAWDFVAEHPEMQLTTINPGMVYGAPMDEHYGSSLETVEMVLKGSPAWPNLAMPSVDVRDVARMHVRAIDNPDTIGKRFPANAGVLPLAQMAQIINDNYGKHISTRTIPDWLIKGLAFIPMMGVMAKNVGINLDLDGTDAEKVMDFTYIPAEDALKASVEYLLAQPKNEK